MIVVPFVPGTFGSTIEYVLRAFTKEYSQERIHRSIKSDGSMHVFAKTDHILSGGDLISHMRMASATNKILTPIYPFWDLTAKIAIDAINQNLSPEDHMILLHVDSLESAEINMLFQYHKIIVGLGHDMDIFCKNSNNITQWNKDYTTWRDMQPWEFREWLSLFYVAWVQEWIDAKDFDVSGIKVSNTEILDHTADVFRKIITHCGLTEDIPIDDFATEWREKQQYILDEYAQLNTIVDCSVSGQDLTWNKLNIVSEAIVQQKLRSQSFAIRCWGLNEFPTDAKTLGSLLENNI
jgi:hypothetical protein